MRALDSLKSFSSKNLQRLGALFFSLAIALLINQVNLVSFESYLYDLRVRFSPRPATSGHITIVSIDPSTVPSLKGVPTVKHHLEALKKMMVTPPQSITYLIKPDQISGSKEDFKEFALLLKKIPSYFLTDELSMKGDSKSLSLPEPLDQLQVFPGPKTTDTTLFAKDGVTRRALYTYQDQPLLQAHLAKTFNNDLVGGDSSKKIRGLWGFLDSQQIYIDYTKRGGFTKIKFEDALKGNFDPKDIKGKIILLGDDLGVSIKNYATTPLSPSIEEGIPLHELNANIVDTFIRNSAPVRSPYWFNFLVTFLISIATLYATLNLRPAKGLVLLVGVFIGFLTFSYLCFWPFGIWLNTSHPILTIFLCYYLFIPYRLIKENRRGWRYYQQHKLLKNVEELKNNFISMMSHDLKTPLARIQGMADVIESSEKKPLSPLQAQAISTIKESSLELTDFVESILNFSRIENDGVHLDIKSQDINQLVKNCIKKLEFRAKNKEIEILTESEPVFSFKMDPYLVHQILTNLIENAIKYSPPKTKILVSTEEKDNFVVVQVSDQGDGISKEDLENVFMKFFRCKKDTNSQTKGSGLGLYLALYFANLHNGKITVESEPAMGSTFTLYLPYNT